MGGLKIEMNQFHRIMKIRIFCNKIALEQPMKNVKEHANDKANKPIMNQVLSTNKKLKTAAVIYCLLITRK